MAKSPRDEIVFQIDGSSVLIVLRDVQKQEHAPVCHIGGLQNGGEKSSGRSGAQGCRESKTTIDTMVK